MGHGAPPFSALNPRRLAMVVEVAHTTGAFVRLAPRERLRAPARASGPACGAASVPPYFQGVPPCLRPCPRGCLRLVSSSSQAKSKTTIASRYRTGGASSGGLRSLLTPLEMAET